MVIMWPDDASSWLLMNCCLRVSFEAVVLKLSHVTDIRNEGLLTKSQSTTITCLSVKYVTHLYIHNNLHEDSQVSVDHGLRTTNTKAENFIEFMNHIFFCIMQRCVIFMLPMNYYSCVLFKLWQKYNTEQIMLFKTYLNLL